MDWENWHDAYDLLDSDLSRRLSVVRDRIREALDGCPPGPLTAISVCAGQGRDLLPVLAGHPRREDVRARLVELDPRNAAIAREAAVTAGLDRVEVVTADASLVDRYLDLAPADLVLLCGIFGNVTDEDVERTVDGCARLCRTDATVIWTRHRREPDLVPQICAWFEERDFERRWVSDPGAGFGVGVHRFAGVPGRLVSGERMFTFAGYDELRDRSQG